MVRRNGFGLVALSFSLLWLGGCGGGGPTATADQSLTQDALPDSAAAPDEIIVMVDPGMDDAGDLDGTELADFPGEALDQVEASQLQPCQSGADCETGVCLGGPQGRYCAPSCLASEECPEGLQCTSVQGTGSDTMLVCLPAATYLCRPCKTKDDCSPPGVSLENYCIEFSPEGSFCGKSCKDNLDCPEGYACRPVSLQNRENVTQCMPTSQECTCTDEFIKAGYETLCYVENEYGKCLGTRKCGPDGQLTECTARTPAPEECNGQDDNCDGTTDEGIEPRECSKTFGGYECTGPEVCEGGQWVCKAQEPTDEKCDGVDDDCDGETDEKDAKGCTKYYRDDDGDSYGVEGDFQCLCAAEQAYSAQVKGDCDDSNPAINPIAPEVCNGEDDDCDGQTDEEGSVQCVTFYWDADGDGVGVADNSKCTCGPDGNYRTQKPGDCNDADPDVFPGQTETCNGKDDDCNGLTDEEGAEGCNQYYFNADGDPYGITDKVRCLCKPDGQYTALQAGDCNDSDPQVFPSATEICNGKDDDCDFQVDEAGAQECKPYYYDGDGDEYGGKSSECLCKPSGKYTATKGGDCSDNDPSVYPGAPEKCDNKDNDCDNQLDEGENNPGCTTYYYDYDGDGYGTFSSKCYCKETGKYSATKSGDCDDNDVSVHPNGSETCDYKDNDCDDSTDEPFWDDDVCTNCGDLDDSWSPGNDTLYSCTDESCNGSFTGRILPMGDKDWFGIFKEETSDWPTSLWGQVTVTAPSGEWYEVCACWSSASGYCAMASQQCVTAKGTTASVTVENPDSWGSDDSGYLDVVIRPATPIFHYSCDMYTANWKVWE